jgi:hypothetical protein
MIAYYEQFVVRLDALLAPRRTERRLANRMSPRLRAVEHAIAARLGLASPSALALCFSLAARFAVAAPLGGSCS